MTKEETRNFFGCSMEQLNNQYAANAAILGKMKDKANKTGKKVNGFTATQLSAYEKKYINLSK